MDSPSYPLGVEFPGHRQQQLTFTGRPPIWLPTDCLTMPGWPPLTAGPTSRRLRDRPNCPAWPVRLVVLGSGGGGGHGRRRRPPPMILEYSLTILDFPIYAPPPPFIYSYKYTCPDTLPKNGKYFLWSPHSPSLPPVRPGTGHPSVPYNTSRSMFRAPPPPHPLRCHYWLLPYCL